MGTPVSSNQKLSRWWWGLAFAAVAGAVAVALDGAQPPTYRAIAVVDQAGTDPDVMDYHARLLDENVEIAAETAARVEGVNGEDVLDAVRVDVVGDRLRISARDRNPSVAAEIANRHAETHVAALGRSGEAQRVALARTPTRPISPRPVRTGMLAAVAAGMGAAFVLRRPRALGRSELPRGVALLADLSGPGSIDLLCDQLRFAAPGDRPARRIITLGVESADPSADVAAPLAVALAQRGLITVLVVGNGPTTEISRLIGTGRRGTTPELHNARSVSAVASTDLLAVATAEDLLREHLSTTDDPNLLVLGTLPGASNHDGASLLGSTVVSVVLDRLAQMADVVVVDVGPLGDPSALPRGGEDLILVCEREPGLRRRVRRSVEHLRAQGREPRGVVVCEHASVGDR